MCIMTFTLNFYKTMFLSGLQMMHSLHIFDALELKFTPFKFVLCMWSQPCTYASEGCAQSSKLCTVRQPEKWEHVLCPIQPRTRHGTTTKGGCDLDTGATPSAQLYTLPFQAQSNVCYENKLKIKKNSFTHCHSKGMVVQVHQLWLFFIDQKSIQ